jgi:hypothetical protein
MVKTEYKKYINMRVIICWLLFLIVLGASCDDDIDIKIPTIEDMFYRESLFQIPSIYLRKPSEEYDYVFLNDRQLDPFLRIDKKISGLYRDSIKDMSYATKLNRGDDFIIKSSGPKVWSEIDNFTNDHGNKLQWKVDYKYIGSSVSEQKLTRSSDMMYPNKIQFKYDKENMLSHTFIDNPWGKSESQSFEYDELGNLTKVINRYAYTFEDPDESGDVTMATSIEQANWTFDSKGRCSNYKIYHYNLIKDGSISKDDLKYRDLRLSLYNPSLFLEWDINENKYNFFTTIGIINLRKPEMKKF